jgi:ADP-heptose:LPS heptosyltransferase
VLGPATRSAELHALAGSLSAVGASAVAEAGALPLEFVQRIARARCVLTVESAAAHLATALDRPAVVLTGGGHFGWFAPWGEGRRQRWVHHPLDCFGCSWVCRRPRVECLEELPPAAVAVAITEVLSRE